MSKFGRVVHAFAVMGLAIRRALRFLFGKVTWEPPPWLLALGRGLRAAGGGIRQRPGRTAAVLAAVLLLAGGGYYARRWYKSLPQPVTVAVTVVPPGLTPIEEKPQPRRLYVDFDASVAPLKNLNKVLTEGVSLEPKVAGAWKWTSDQRLTFIPKEDWGIGQEYHLRLAKKGLVAEHVRLDKYEDTFSSAPFEVSVAQAEFYQDPADQNMKKLVATFNFSHPVDPASFEPQLRVRLRPSDKEDAPSQPGFRVTYDKLKGHAYVHSLPITPGRKDATIELELEKGTRAARGGRPYEEKLSTNVRVPGLYNFLRVSGARVSLVDNERLEPEQILFIETTVGVTDNDLRKAVSATLLPDKDADGKPHAYYNAEEIGPEVLKRSQPVALSPVASEKDYGTAHGFKLEAPVGRRIYVKVNKGLRGFGGYLLAEVSQHVVTVPAYPRQLKLLQEGSLLALSGDRKVSVYARDVPGLRIEIGRLLPHQLQHLVSQGQGSFSHPGLGSSLDESNLAEFFTEERPLAKAKPGKPQYEAIDLGKYLDGAGSERRGVFLVKVESWDPASKHTLGESDQRLMLVSNLGILAKQNADATHEVFVQSIQNGQPVAGAKVSVIGRNGLPVLTETTDRDGHVSFPKLEEYGREKTPTLFLVSSGPDQSFLPFGRRDRLLDTSRFDVGGVSEDGPTHGLNAFLFSDRGLYRPGEEIRVALVVKSRDWAGNLEGLPLEAVVTDARGLTVKQQRLKLGAAGFEEIRHTTPDVAPTGKYTVSVYVVKDNRQDTLLGSTEVEVREFLPDRMKIRASLSAESPEGWVSPQDLKARVNLANLFGTPATGRRVRALLTLTPWVPHFPRHRGYVFFDPMRAKEGASEQLPDGKTDDDGEAELELRLGRFAPATYRLSVVTEGFEAEGGRSVTAEVSSVVSPLPYLIGWKAEGGLGYLGKGTDSGVDLLAIDPHGRPTEAKGLKAVLMERRYVSVLVRQDNGTYRYQSMRKEIERERKGLDIGKEGKRWKVPTDTPGDYMLSIRNAADEEQQRIEFSVTGYGNLSREVEKNGELKLALKAGDVEPGQDLEMQIKAPFTGAGLITIERDKVYAWKWFRADSTASVQTIKVPEGLEGNGYLSVSFIRDPGSPDVFMSPLSYGVLPFSVSRAKRKLGLEVHAPDLVKPGQTLKLRYKSDRPGKVVLFAVDEGILRVAGYHTPDPLGFFFEKRALSVRTSQILDMILPEYQRLLQSLAPGGDAEGAIGANLNPFRRKQQKPVACWSGIVDVGTKEKEYGCEVPDHFSGTLRVMAVAVAPDAIAAFEDRTLVRGDFVISPNVPTFLAPGDETDVSVSVTNAVVGSGKNAAVTLALKTSAGLEVLGAPEAHLSINELREATAKFRVRARAPLGSASLAFTAKLDSNAQKNAKLTTDLSVRPAAPYMTTFAAGHMKGDDATVPVPRKLYAEYRTLEAGISYVPLGLAHGLVGYLEKFPHGCTEQVTSQALPAVALGKHPEFGFDGKKAAGAVAHAIELLRSRQNEDGAFGRWAANPAVDRTATVWAAHVLTEARERGFAVPADMQKSLGGFLQTLAAEDPDDLPAARLQAWATYVLALSGMNTGRFVAAQVKHLEANFAEAWKGDVAALFLAAANKLGKQDRLGREVLEQQHVGQAVAADFEYYQDRLAHDAQVLYLLSRHFPERAARLGAADITAIADPIFNGAYTTFSSAWAILALETYARAATTNTDGKLTVAELVGDKPQPLSLPANLLPSTAFSDKASAIRFMNSGQFDAYWVVGQRGFDQTLPAEPLSRKLEIFREYTDDAGKPVTSVKLGDEIQVHVRLRSLDSKAINHIAVVDLLPGGFEPVVQVAGKTRDHGSGGDHDPQDDPAPKENEGENAEPTEGAEGEESGEGEAPHESEGESEPATPTFALPIALSASTFSPTYGDVREDRVVLYGMAETTVKELIYVIRATNTGTFTIAPILADAMYDRSVLGRGVAGRITITAP